LAVHQQHARDRRGPGLGVELVERAEVGAERHLLDLELADLQAHAAPARQLAVGDELLQALVERPRGRLPDVGAAALAAHDLAALLEPAECGAQRAARDPQPRGQLLLGR
jgi:hypothetical protein